MNIRYEDLGSLPIDDAYVERARYTGPPGYDPEPALRSLSIPTLWLLGGQDRLVPTRECVEILGNLRATGSGVEFVVYPTPHRGHWERGLYADSLDEVRCPDLPAARSGRLVRPEGWKPTTSWLEGQNITCQIGLDRQGIA